MKLSIPVVVDPGQEYKCGVDCIAIPVVRGAEWSIEVDHVAYPVLAVQKTTALGIILPAGAPDIVSIGKMTRMQV